MSDLELGSFLARKNVVITGGSSGLGQKIAEALRDYEANVIILGRRAAAPPHDDAVWMQTDLAFLEQTMRASRRIRSSWSRVDMLINNAGCLVMDGRMGPDGLEPNLAVNYLSHYALTRSLLDLLEQSPAALVVNVGSAAADRRKGCASDDFFRKPASPRAAYERSKWALSAFSFTLADAFRERGTAARSILLRPPFMNTGIIRNNAGGSLKSRLFLKVLERLGAFTDCNAVAGAALDVVQQHGAGSDYAVWSRKANGFVWANRPGWSRDAAATADLLNASDTACGRVLGPEAAALRPLRESR